MIWPYNSNTKEWNPDQRGVYDIVYLGNYTLPGISIISNIQRARKFQEVKNKESHYSNIVDNGLELAKFTITNTVITQEDANEIEKIVQYFDAKLGVSKHKPGNKKSYVTDTVTGLPVQDKSIGSGEQGSISIIHPLCKVRGIDSVYIYNIEGPIINRIGKIVTTFYCIEVKKQIRTASKKVKPKGKLAEGDSFKTPYNNPKPSSDLKNLLP